ncbi:MAG: alpha-hydroxy acid oxidase, partial [Thermomicrobiales bacterium]
AAARDHHALLAWHYLAGGSEDESSLRANREAFAHWRLLPRVLRGVTAVSTATQVLGQPLALPVLLAPTGRHGLSHPDGELATAGAPRPAGTVYVTSTVTTAPIEQVAVEAGPWWQQLYVYRDRERTREQVQRVAAAGASALVVTVDAQARGRREAEERAAWQERLADPIAHAGRPAGSPLAKEIAGIWDLSLTWADLEWLATLAPLPILVKGVLHPEDARQAMHYGAAGILVSNHGGRQLDGAVGALDALSGVAAAVGGRVPVLVDGGVRRGTDILVALALGAQAVLIGRPVHWGLALGGEAGVARVLTLLQDELARALWLCGLSNPSGVTRELVAPHRS